MGTGMLSDLPHKESGVFRLLSSGLNEVLNLIMAAHEEKVETVAFDYFENQSNLQSHPTFKIG
jgi:hypothetical protein